MPTLLKSVLIAAILCLPTALFSKEHRVLMLNVGTTGGNHPNVFEPAIVYADLGDTITFVPSDTGHNAASKRGMLPDGADPWNSPMDTEFTITVSIEGIYGYVCVPHYEMGMVGLIVVGDAWRNLDAAQKVRHPGRARKAFRALFADIEPRN